jgi:hypothetical protein
LGRLKVSLKGLELAVGPYLVHRTLYDSTRARQHQATRSRPLEVRVLVGRSPENGRPRYVSLAHIEGQGRAMSTLVRYRSAIEANIKPRLGSISIAKLGPADVDRF